MTHLKYFIGKAVTVLTHPVNFNQYDSEQLLNYFVGIVEDVDQFGIMIRHPATHCKTCIMMNNIIAIAEEQVLDESKPEDAKIIQEYRTTKPNSANLVLKSTKVNPTELKNLAELAKNITKKV